MNSHQREALRQDVVRWIRSKDFESYFDDLHVKPSALGLASLGCLLKPGRFSPSSILRGAQDRGVATGGLRRRYCDLAQAGQVVMTYTYMANTALTSGEAAYAPALLVAGADGTEEAEKYVWHIMQKLVEITERPPSTPEEQNIQAMLADEEFRVFRVRTLPLGFTENYPIYAFDTMLHRSAVAGGELQSMPCIGCIVHPQMQPAILPIPFALIAPYLRTSEAASRDHTIAIDANNGAMHRTVEEARATLPKFWDVFERRPQGESGLSLKARITDSNGVELLWLTEIERRDGRILGRVNNDPAIVTVVKLGDKVEVPEQIIADWSYQREGKMVGNYTLRVMFYQMPPEEIARYRQIMSDS